MRGQATYKEALSSAKTFVKDSLADASLHISEEEIYENRDVTCGMIGLIEKHEIT